MGIDVNKLAPDLFDSDQTEYSYAQKQGGILDFYIPDFEKMKLNKKKESKLVKF